jgi:hypothetical protein
MSLFVLSLLKKPLKYVVVHFIFLYIPKSNQVFVLSEKW